MKKILAFVLLVSFISGAGLIFSGCSKDDNNKKKITGGATAYSFEGTWEREDYSVEFYKFTGSNVIYVRMTNTNTFLSQNGTFEDHGTYLEFHFTSQATGNAITGSVTWLAYDHGTDIVQSAYSTIDATHMIIVDKPYKKIS